MHREDRNTGNSLFLMALHMHMYNKKADICKFLSIILHVNKTKVALIQILFFRFTTICIG